MELQLKTVDDFHKEEEIFLSPLAVKSSSSAGRIYPESEHAYRPCFMRDRDRIVHSNSFKRLEYKTQVFIYSEGDHFRNRLTHTLEVAGISRTIASAMGLNSFLSESIALAHDLGHAPFGHAGQDILSDLMRDYGGFEHNKQSLRIVQKLEKKYPDFPGLNLSIETLKGIKKHGGDYDSSGLINVFDQGPALEAMVTDFADEIAYNSHDIEDGIESGLILEDDIAEVSLWQKHYMVKKSVMKNKNQSLQGLDRELLNRAVLRNIMNDMVTDLLTNTLKNLRQNGIVDRKSLLESWQKGLRPVGYSDEMRKMVIELKRFLKEFLYQHIDVRTKSENGKQIIEKLFHYYLKNDKKIPESFRSRLEKDGKHRVVCDYIAGMTDRFAENTVAML